MTQNLSRRGMALAPAAAAVLVVACVDPAEADWRRCQELEKKGDFGDAIRACHEAHGKGPLTKSGRKAKARIPVLQELAEQKVEEDVHLKVERARSEADGRVEELMKKLNEAESEPQAEEARKELEKLKQGGK